jgi:hypothetical protein
MKELASLADVLCVWLERTSGYWLDGSIREELGRIYHDKVDVAVILEKGVEAHNGRVVE